jgi:hypothetical protein
MKRTILVLPVLLLAAACANTAAPAAANKPGAPGAAAPGPRHEPLLVALESSGGPTAQPEAIAIAGLDGVARAKAHFDPPIQLPVDFSHRGWIDLRTVAGQIASGDLAYVSLDNPGRAIDFGFRGQFVGGLLT